MLYFLNELSNESIIDCDVCIIGSGFAGLALAKKLSSRKKLKIVVMEGSSGWYGTISAHHPPLSPREQYLYEGSLSGWISQANNQYLLASRTRTFGGTSAIWSGWNLTLDESDLTRHKDYVWPISYDELSVYYSEAKKFLNIKDRNYDQPHLWISDSFYEQLESLPSRNTPLKTRILQLNPIRLHRHYVGLFSGSTDLYRNANLVELSSSNGSVKEAYFLSNTKVYQKVGIKVRANCFVLALGALETTRQLFLAGVENKWLGCNFMEHPYIWEAASFSHSSMPEPVRRFYDGSRPTFSRDGSGFVGILAPNEKYLSSNKIGSFRALLYMPEGQRGWLNLSFEQFPNKKLGISLGEKRDLFGNPLLHLDSHWRDSDIHTIDRSISITCEFLKKRNLISSIHIPKPLVVPGFHPAGTTRMGKNSSEGVVDENGKVYEKDNLYISSSSNFPTCGYANPTLTIVAISMRLSDHLIKERFCGFTS